MDNEATTVVEEIEVVEVGAVGGVVDGDEALEGSIDKPTCAQTKIMH